MSSQKGKNKYKGETFSSLCSVTIGRTGGSQFFDWLVSIPGLNSPTGREACKALLTKPPVFDPQFQSWFNLERPATRGKREVKRRFPDPLLFVVRV